MRRNRFCALYHSDFASWVINAQRQILRPLSFRTPFRYPEAIVSNKTRRQIMVILRLVSTERNKFDSIGMMCRYWSFSDFYRFRWQEGSLAERCFARTKLVSYLYFPFIYNKRQVKRGNCHTLILSGDLCLVACNFHLTILRYLAPIVRQFVKFRDMPELKRKHRCTIREVP